jgi:hypothetical protein
MHSGGWRDPHYDDIFRTKKTKASLRADDNENLATTLSVSRELASKKNQSANERYTVSFNTNPC